MFYLIYVIVWVCFSGLHFLGEVHVSTTNLVFVVVLLYLLWRGLQNTPLITHIVWGECWKIVTAILWI